MRHLHHALHYVPPAPRLLLAVEWSRRAVAAVPVTADRDDLISYARDEINHAERAAFDPVIDRRDAAETFEVIYTRFVVTTEVAGGDDDQSAEALFRIVTDLWDARVNLPRFADSAVGRDFARSVQLCLNHAHVLLPDAAAQLRTAQRAKPLAKAKLAKLPALHTPTLLGLARGLWLTLDPVTAAVLADALDEARVPAELSEPYRAEPDTLTRADWLFWHLGCPAVTLPAGSP